MSFPPKKPGARLGQAMPSPMMAEEAAEAGAVAPVKKLAGRPPTAAAGMKAPKKMPPVKSTQDLRNIFKSKFGSK